MEMNRLIRKVVNSADAPKPLGPYSQAVVADRTVYVSGCLGLNKETMTLVPGGVAEQTKAALMHMKTVLEACDSGIEKVVKTNVFVKDLNHFAEVNEIYKRVFSHDFPARSCVQVARLPMDALVEIECVALAQNVLTVSS